MRLRDKVILISGAGFGMGRETAKIFADEGASLMLNDINESDLKNTLSMLKGGTHQVYAGDISDSSMVMDMFAEIKASYKRIDGVVNNAGIGRSPGDGENAEIHETNDEGWRGVIGVNLDGAFYITREAVRLMFENKTKGSIVNISSTSAYTGDGPLAYCTSKGALLSFTRALALNLSSKGIRVNAICPGPISGRMMDSIPQEYQDSLAASIPLGRLGQPEEVARTSLFLLSDDSSFFTGQTLSPNGGSYMH
ncbi:MAG: SDR family NAD(P)-dependent oxidoreductase [SAR86 cluster bacterium]|mgnify:CR=1 FL=1|nr:SDR family NAD(P)-dependent oxidoreductase [SAR86 cluster bacterium]